MTVGIYHVFESTYNCWGKLDAKTCMSSRLYPLTVDFEFVFPAYFYYIFASLFIVHVLTVFLHNLLPCIILYRTNKPLNFALQGLSITLNVMRHSNFLIPSFVNLILLIVGEITIIS